MSAQVHLEQSVSRDDDALDGKVSLIKQYWTTDDDNVVRMIFIWNEQSVSGDDDADMELAALYYGDINDLVKVTFLQYYGSLQYVL